MATEQEKATMNEATNAMMSAGMMLEELTTWNTKLVATIAERDAENERLHAAIQDAANKIFFMPTWVESDSYRAQIDMRKRCYEVVAAMVKID